MHTGYCIVDSSVGIQQNMRADFIVRALAFALNGYSKFNASCGYLTRLRRLAGIMKIPPGWFIKVGQGGGASY